MSTRHWEPPCVIHSTSFLLESGAHDVTCQTVDTLPTHCVTEETRTEKCMRAIVDWQASIKWCAVFPDHSGDTASAPATYGLHVRYTCSQGLGHSRHGWQQLVALTVAMVHDVLRLAGTCVFTTASLKLVVPTQLRPRVTADMRHGKS